MTQILIDQPFAAAWGILGMLCLVTWPLFPSRRAMLLVQLGIGVGWMEAEFRALDIPRSRRGAITDETLELLLRCFSSDEIDVNGQTVLFLPRPERPPLVVGGTGPHVLGRAARYADGWAAPNDDPDALRQPIVELRRLFAEAGKPEPEVIAAGRLSLDDCGSVREKLARLTEVGVTRYALGVPYSSAHEFRSIAEELLRARG